MQVGERYQLQKRLGSGSFSSVCLALDTSTGEKVGTLRLILAAIEVKGSWDVSDGEYGFVSVCASHTVAAQASRILGAFGYILRVLIVVHFGEDGKVKGIYVGVLTPAPRAILVQLVG